MRTLFRVFVWIGLLLIGSGAMAQGPAAADATKLLADRVEGRADAPVAIIDYSSLTCPHCADFHMKVLPRIKREYIDTGKVKLVFRDFPLDGVALAASMLARCAPEAMYYRFLDALFGGQAEWTRAANPRKALVGFGRLAGMSQEAVDACFANEALLNGIQAMKAEGQTKYGVDSTPSFIVNGTRRPGVSTYEQFTAIIDPLLKK